MPIESVKIPQNVYVEDRIIGPITLRQLMLVMISGGISYGIWTILQSAGATGIVTTVISWTPVVVGASFAFVKFNGLSLLRIILLSLEKLEKPSKRIWMPRRGIYINITTTAQTSAHENPDIARKRRSHEQTRMEELSELLDQGPDEDAIQETADKEEMEFRRIQQNTAAARKSLPVNPERIRADRRNAASTSVDGITPTTAQETEQSQGVFRDILPPPPSHA